MDPIESKPPAILEGAATLPPMKPNKATLSASIQKDNRRASQGDRRGAGDRFRILNDFVDCSMADLTRAELATWMILYRDTRDGIARAAQSDIATRAGLSERAIRNAIGSLEQAGLLQVVYRGGLNRGVSRYKVFPQRKQTSC
ncbi:MAG: hypothetical protein ACK5ZC_02915 [Pirellulaceae bacterium]